MAMHTRREAVVMDVDQVLLDYYARLREWVNKRYKKRVVGLPVEWDMTTWLQFDNKECTIAAIIEFSKSYEFGTLDAFPGADVVLHELLREGYSLIGLTACGSHPVTEALRRANLFHRFGDIFEEIHFVEMTDSKIDKMAHIQERYDVIAFIDDKPSNIEDIFFGADVDHCILMKAPHNRDWRQGNVLEIDHAFSWYECKQLINNYSQLDN